MSEVKVNKISPRSGTGVQLGDSGDTITIPAGANATLGGAGSTISIPAGATITNSGTAAGFGATGAASWDTTVKTGDFTAVSGVGYFVNTTGGEIDVTLPASPSAGDVVAVSDYANNFATANCILLRNGSNIGGVALDSTLTTNGIAATLVFVDATKGWIVTDSGNQTDAPTQTFIAATGGTESDDGNFRVHTFTGPGNFTVNSVGNAAGSNEVSYLIVAGGGGGGGGAGSGYCAGGGGAGGYREGKTPQCTYTASPIACTAGSNNGILVTAQSYPIVIGGGGPGAPGTQNAAPAGTPGDASSALGLTSAGGGGGGSRNTPSGGVHEARDGGSGGGAGQADNCAQSNTFGIGNTPPVSPSQGSNGGRSSFPNGSPGDSGTGAGGGATAVGGNSAPGTALGGVGGAGATTSINGTPTAFAGGGGGAGTPCSGGCGGAGGGGNGSGPGQPTTNGSDNTGGGGGGGSGNSCRNGGTGGSGVVIIRYKFQ